MRRLDPSGPAIKIHAKLPPPLLDRIDEEARRLGVNRSTLLRQWIEQGLDREQRTA